MKLTLVPIREAPSIIAKVPRFIQIKMKYLLYISGPDAIRKRRTNITQIKVYIVIRFQEIYMQMLLKSEHHQAVNFN